MAEHFPLPSSDRLSSYVANDARPDTDEALTVAIAIAEAAEDRKGADIVLLRVAEVSYLADYFLIITGFSPAQVRAIANAIQQRVGDMWQRLPLRIEGQSEGNWVLIDYGDIIVHIMQPHERQFYNLEAFWGHAEQIPLAALYRLGE